ncbi:hypothetical protein LSH36_356g03041 [Paralvinella palmiformis]|uniref:Uncharacterized protein n=1 Tax=Paralvinella palmiformis TaxID=53620 RepID=A0AAD9JGB3_9ANNE|nr:hypothetical protein LSH36_356g03041 [Paralvinella palmiformis]
MNYLPGTASLVEEIDTYWLQLLGRDSTPSPSISLWYRSPSGTTTNPKSGPVRRVQFQDTKTSYSSTSQAYMLHLKYRGEKLTMEQDVSTWLANCDPSFQAKAAPFPGSYFSAEVISISPHTQWKANLVLHRTIERIHVEQKYGDIPRGIFVVRGENVVLLGEIDLEKEDNLKLEEVSVDEILALQREVQLQKQVEEEKKKRALVERGMMPHTDPIQEDFF